LHDRYGIESSTRASFYLYSTTAEVDALIEGIYDVKRVFG
jgi:cysteine desulfurase/selenocysteine lyase